MTVQTLKLGRERYVILKEKDYRKLVGDTVAGKPRRSRALSAQDRGDIAEARRRLADPNDKPVDYAATRKRLGLS